MKYSHKHDNSLQNEVMRTKFLRVKTLSRYIKIIHLLF